jgi:hypothetical protein
MAGKARAKTKAEKPSAWADPNMERIHSQAPKFTPREADELEKAIGELKPTKKR